MSGQHEDRKRALSAAQFTISSARAREIKLLCDWKNGGVLGGLPRPSYPSLTPEEDELIRQLWLTLDGSACWMDALSMLCRS